MIDITFDNLIILAPIPDETKEQIRRAYPTYDSSQQSEVVYLLWGIYRTYRSFLREQLRVELTNKMVNEMSAPPEDLDTYIEKQVELKLKEAFNAHAESSELAALRAKLEKYITANTSSSKPLHAA